MSDDALMPEMPMRLKGKLLLADPSLRDGMFRRSVVLLNEHLAEDGASGLILNRPTGRVVGDFLQGEEFEGMRHVSVFEGGPVDTAQMMFGCFWWSRKLGLRWALRMTVDQARSYSSRPGRIVRAFIGYSGWSAGQLEGEMERRSWITVDPPVGLLGQVHDRSLWMGLLRGLSPFHRILAEAPDDPFLN